MEITTKFKNKEIDNNNLNQELSINLSFVLSKCNTKKPINKDEDNNYFKKEKKKGFLSKISGYIFLLMESPF